VAVFIFLTDFCNKFDIPGPYRNIDKALIVLYHMVYFNKFFTIYDNMCFDGLYINTLLETIRKFSTRNLDINTTNFTYPINKEKNKKLEADEDKMNRYVAGFRSRIETFFSKLGQTFKRFSGDNNIRVTKLATYNIQLRLACVLMNIRQLSELADLDLQPKYTFWLNEKYDYP
ncbi:hypothetical protein EDC94DRAFT_486759, partial [Helicostylum pulchrum]